MRLFTTEQISRWHPDKVADQISDAILGRILEADPDAHCGIETMVKSDHIFVCGEVTSKLQHKDVERIAANTADDVMYELGYYPEPAADYIDVVISSQSSEINEAVEKPVKKGAGDQGMMFGYATNRTESMLPYGFEVANKVIHYIEEAKCASDQIKGTRFLQGDAKCLVTEDLDASIYDPDNRIKSINISVCEYEGKDVAKLVIPELISDKLEISQKKIVVNPAGHWTIGGPTADCGLTGRKIVADQYGGYCAVGGGAFSGKDFSKVDRTAAYMARVIAKDVCKRYALDEAAVQLGYMIGQSDPVSVYVETDGKCLSFINDYVTENYDLTPSGMMMVLKVNELDLRKLSAGCHFRPVKWGGLG